MTIRGQRRGVSALLAFWACVAGMTTVVHAGAQDWNDKGIAWKSYDEGLAEAKKTRRPVCLIFYTTWCPHCTNYANVFNDPKVVEKSKSFVMVRLDKDKHGELSKRYSPDGEYIPRTYFLSSTGELDASLSETRERFKYFYSESDPASLLAGMDRALQELR